ncbi:MAG TPA: FtsK/SpoIIIE domain-containing protein [Verrucomicrobiae bacterium]|nr:FtsK/SpoIIIE domain-containing protein [Verrucomicrobiae bacterium]
MSSQLSAGKTLELVEGLRTTINEIAARANALASEVQVKTAKERRRREAADEEHARQLKTDAAEAEANYRAAKAAAQTRYEQRKGRIGKAYQASKEQGLVKIEQQIGGRKYELQRAMLQAEKDRDTALADAGKRIEELRRGLQTEEEALAELEALAQRSFGGLGGYRRLFLRAYGESSTEPSQDEVRLLAGVRDEAQKARGELSRFRKFLPLPLVRFLPAWLALALCEIPAARLLTYSGVRRISLQTALVSAGASLLLILAAWFIARRKARPLALSISRTLAHARRLHDVCHQQSEAHYVQELDRANGEFQSTTSSVDHELKKALADAGEWRVSWRMRSDERAVSVHSRNERAHRARLERLEREYHILTQRLKASAAVRLKALKSASEEQEAKLTAEYEAQRRDLESEWNGRLVPIYQTLEAASTAAATLFPAWNVYPWADWKPPAQFSQAARFAELQVDVAQLCQALPKDRALALPGPARFSAPLCLAYPEQGSILFETGGTGHVQAIGALNNIILRLLSTAPPGRLNFTILDPVGLGQNFAGVMHLADFEEQIINNRIWTQSTQIEQKLADLNEHMEKVIQMYLRNEYQTIAEYNEQAGVIAEKYHFLVVADFPANFTDTAAKRLLSIAASGARCGVYTLIHWDRRQPLPQDFIPDELRKSSLCVSEQDSRLIISGKPRPGAELALDEPPPPELATEFIQLIGRFSRDSSRVEVPFKQVAPAESEIWSQETAQELVVSIGRTGATKLQQLAIGKGTRQHGLIAGKTGSGKSTLFHVIITNLALWCSPEQVEFYLVDFKKGVEFKCYAAKRLPHARVVAIESDREFGLSVLQRVDDELRRRGDLLRQLGAQDIAGYKRAGGREPMPRTLLMVDEFQEFFVEDDRIAQTASLLLDRIVRQGRAFGIHVLLGSQTLGGAYTVARTTLGQMVIRIALQCNEADAYLIMDENNPAPRLLSRPGEGIYNDMAGALEGNSPFQVVWLPEDVRDANLAKVRQRADSLGEAFPGPIVFEGNAPAHVQENVLLRVLLEAKVQKPVAAARIWLGAPNSIKGPTEVVFQRQSGNNLLIVGQREETILGLVSIGLLCLAAQYAPGNARFFLCDASPPGTPAREYLERVVNLIPHQVALARPGDMGNIMKELGEERKKRAEDMDSESAPPVFLFIHGLQRFTRLRYEEEFGFSAPDADAEPNPAVVLNDLVCDGTRLGFHVIAACDTYNTVNRFLSRKAFSEFEMRVLFQMSANDSASLIDNPKAGLLGLHRALFFNAQEGYLETFRPYALPEREWLEQAGQHLERLLPRVPV